MPECKKWPDVKGMGMVWKEQSYLHMQLRSSLTINTLNMLVFQFDNNIHDIYSLACALYKQGNVGDVYGSSYIVGTVCKSA